MYNQRESFIYLDLMIKNTELLTERGTLNGALVSNKCEPDIKIMNLLMM
jgi:hypothetical protein